MNKKNILILVSVAIALVFVVYGCYVYVLRMRDDNKSFSVKVGKTNTTTYTNEIAGFTFRQPSNWVVTEYGGVEEAKTIEWRTQETINKRSELSERIKVEGGPIYDYGLLLSNLITKEYDNINEFAKRSGHREPNFQNLGHYLFNEPYLPKIVGVLMIDGSIAAEVNLGEYALSYGVLIERERKIYSLEFPEASDRSKLTEEDWAVISSFTFLK